MAAPSYASDLTDVGTVPPTNSGFSAFGGGASGLNNESDYYIIDSSCCSKNAWASDYKGMMYDNSTDLTIPNGDALFVWLYMSAIDSVDTEAGGGLRINCADANTESSFDSWYVGGSDTILYDDRWLCAVVDIDETPDLNNGATQNYSWFGAGADLPTGGPTKGAPFAIGAIRYGREFQCTAGDLGNGYATFDGAATYNDASTRRFGQFQLSGGVYKSQGCFVMGTATTAVDFRDSNRAIFVARTPKVGATFNGFEVRNASSRVDWTNISISALGTQSPGYFEMIANADVNMLNCVFTGMGDFDFLSNGSAIGCTWRNCGQITVPGCDLTGSVVEGYEGTADSSALIWNVNTNPNTLLEGMSFTKGTAATHAIEFGTSIPSAITLRDMTFTSYGADDTTSSALYFADTAGTITVTLTGTTQPTYKTAGCTVVFVTNTVDTTLKAQNTSGTAILNARAFLYATSTTGSLPAGDTVTIVNSGTTATVTHTGHGLATNDKVWIQGASLSENNGVWSITKTGTDTYTYTMGSSPGSSPTGTITATFVFVNGLTDVNGEISLTRSLPADQSVAGWARRGSSGDDPRYKQGPVAGTASSTQDTTFTAVLISDE